VKFNQTQTKAEEEAMHKLQIRITSFGAYLLVMLVVAGCASTKVVKTEQLVAEKLPRPDTIWVYDFVATAADAPADSLLAGEADVDTAAPQTEKQIAQGRELGAAIASQLIMDINKAGMHAAKPVSDTLPQINDIVIRGYLLSIKPGSAAKRVVIGFGAGGSELHTLVEAYQVTAQGERRLGSGTVQSGGNKSPGAALGVATFLVTANPVGLIVGGGMKVYGEASGKSKIQGNAKATAQVIAKDLKKRFKRQGWLNEGS
jgi:hypothetical protein